jgi:hypothetical protein
VGSIDVPNNSNIKVIGNTVKDCTFAATISASKNTDTDAPSYNIMVSPQNIIFAENHFINCNTFKIYSATNITPDILDCVISNNIFENTNIYMSNVGGIIVHNNIFKGEVVVPYVTAKYGSRISITNNSMSGASANNYGLEIQYCNNISIKGNYILASKNIIYDCKNPLISENVFHQLFVADNDKYSIILNSSTNTNVMFVQNTVVAYTGGFKVPSYTTVQGNQFFIAPDAPVGFAAAEVPTGANYVIFKDNRKVGKNFVLKANETNVYDNNDVEVYDDIFQTLSMTLSNITSSSVPSKLILGDAFSFVLTADEGYSLPDTINVTNGGVNSTREQDYYYDKTTGKVTISCVKGEVVITASGNAI